MTGNGIWCKNGVAEVCKGARRDHASKQKLKKQMNCDVHLLKLYSEGNSKQGLKMRGIWQ